MKKLLILPLAICCFMLTSCGGDDCEQADWLGTYVGTSDCDQEDPIAYTYVITAGSTENTIIVTTDGDSVTYTIDGCSIDIPEETFDFTGISITTQGTITLDGNQLNEVISSTSDGTTTTCSFTGSK